MIIYEVRKLGIPFSLVILTLLLGGAVTVAILLEQPEIWQRCSTCRSRQGCSSAH